MCVNPKPQVGGSRVQVAFEVCMFFPSSFNQLLDNAFYVGFPKHTRIKWCTAAMCKLSYVKP